MKKVVILIVIAVIGAWVSTYFLLHNEPDRGTFGDMFGGLNALFSGFAFVGVIYAIMLQSKELFLQRNELELTRNELAGQKEQLEAQNKTLKKQNFENTFFALLKIQNEITGAIDLIDGNNRVTKGRDCFQIFYKRFSTLWNRKASSLDGDSEQERINKTYMNFFRGHESEFGHYFRSLYNIIKFIDQSDIEDKRLYTNLVRAQLSSFEQALLFYNSLSELGVDKFKPLIERYSLLKTVPRNELLNPDEHLKLYEPEAYS